MRAILILGPDGVLRKVDKREREDGVPTGGDTASVNNGEEAQTGLAVEYYLSVCEGSAT